jgi:diadenylate cyclase
MTLFRLGFLTFTVIDLLDIVAVYYVLFTIYKIMKGTRAVQMFAGLLVIIISAFLFQMLNMEGMSWLIKSFSAVWIIAFVILFQPELRRLLIQIGQTDILRTVFKTGENRTITAVAEAAQELSQRHYGGLIVLQKDTGLKGIIETGIKLQAEISAELLISIFSPRTPLHDGAAIVSDDLVQAAKCILPLSQNPGLERSMGTRHRAALGITEETDAVVVVVSEETGRISLAHSSEFVDKNIDGEQLKKYLNDIFEKDRVKNESK